MSPAISITSAVEGMPSYTPDIVITLGVPSRASSTSVVRPCPRGSFAEMEWTCMIVVGTAR